MPLMGELLMNPGALRLPSAGAGSMLGAMGGIGSFLTGLAIPLQLGGLFTAASGASLEAQSRQYQLRSQALQYELSAKLAEINANMVEMQARQILKAGRREAMVIGLKTGEVQGTARASMAARGLDLGVGSPAEVMATTDIMKEIDLLTVNSNTSWAIMNKKSEASSYRAQSLIDAMSASNRRGAAAMIDPGYERRTTLLGGAAQVAKFWAPYLIRE